MINFNKKLVLITGASSGLGKEMARVLALYEGADIIIAARRIDKLEALKKDIESKCSSKVYIIKADVGSKEGSVNLYKNAIKIGKVYAVINNAGMTNYGKTIDSGFDRYQQMLDVNVRAVLQLTYLFLKYFNENDEGAILNITSMAAFVPNPYQNVYAASKHAVQAYTEGLYHENKNKNIIISSFAPGGIATEMLTNSGLDNKFKMNSSVLMPADKVAKIAIKSFRKGNYCKIPGLMNKLSNLFVKVLPRKIITKILEKIYRPD